ncbi:MAG: SDR family oxidoreductase, partial [Hyphomicrobiaceae bacterium]
GSACMKALAEAGFEVTGIGRSRRSAMALDPSGRWIIRDLPTITVADWRDLLSGADVIVNASGALQDGGQDDLEAIHVTAISRLVEAAAEMALRIIQISAAGVSDHASTAFFRTKARGDAIISNAAQDWVILRPTLVLSHDAYGGTALLRAAAALPLVLPRIMPGTLVQTMYVGDVAKAVVAAAKGDVPTGTIADLTETDARSFPELLSIVRRWQGWPPPLLTLPVPSVLLRIAASGADLLGHLGWRSPLRATALRALADGIRGDAATWETAGGAPCRSLGDTLALLPATRQDRVFARAYFGLPLAIGTLALFWCLSGFITLGNPARAMAVLSGRGAGSWISGAAVMGGAVADLVLGFAILWRAWARRAALGMIGLSCVYLIGSIALTPDLWADPLGPMVKVFPGMALAAMVWLLLEDR